MTWAARDQSLAPTQGEDEERPGLHTSGLSPVEAAVIKALRADDGLAGGLYVVATPIGNLRDVSLRALRVLDAADCILAEDTRHARKLLSRYGISGKGLVSLHEHNEKARTPGCLQMLEQGHVLAMVSDAGMPLVSDPGGMLVAEVARAGHPVVPVPGPSAVMAALAGSGLPAMPFLFTGFLPAKASKRAARMRSLAKEPATLVLFAPPRGLARVLAEAAKAMGPGRRTTLEDAARFYADQECRGEVTLVIEGSSDEAPAQSESEQNAVIRQLLETGQPASSVVKEVAKRLQLPRNEAYQRVLQLQQEQS